MQLIALSKSAVFPGKSDNSLIDNSLIKKTWLIMKMTIVLLTIACLQLSAKGYTQSVTLTVKNAPLEKVFREIKKQTGYDFWYESKLLQNSKKVTLELKNTSLENALDECFRDQPFTYSIVDKIIVVKLKPLTGFSTITPVVTGSAGRPPLLIDISGTITGDDGQPLAGATILVKGTPNGTKSDANGTFSINAEPNSILIISFVGYESTEVKVGNLTNVTVRLKPSVSVSDEVVVIGYGTQKKRDVSSAISSVFSKDLQDKPVSNFAQAISGKMAGVRILNSNNAPGGGTNIVIRGINSINASNNPLIVIDGFPLQDGFDKTENPLNAINTADIESIEVLKDASSGAIYGARASNGVILITTKKGKSGSPEISLNINSGFEKMTNKMHMLDREDFLKYMDDARAQAYIVEDPNFGTNNPDAPQWKWTDSDETRIYNWNNFSSNAPFMGQGGTYYDHWIHVTPETKAQPYDNDWQDLTTKVGSIQDFQLSTRGGNDNVKYMVSGGYFNQDGIVKSAGYNRYSFRANLDIKINNWLKTGLLLAPSIENLDVMYNIEGAFYDIVTIPPIYRAYDDNGDPQFLGYIPGDYREWNLPAYSNPLANDLVQDKRRTFRNLSTLFAEINITKGLTFRSEFHTEFRNWERNYFMPSSFPGAWSANRSMGLNNVTSRLYWNSQSFLTYNRIFKKHSVNAILGYSAEESSDRSTFISKLDFPTDQVPTLNQAITLLNAQGDARNNRSGETMIGSFARVLYNFSGKYYFTGSIRRDGSSKFGADRKWGVFPSFSAAWRVSDESFFTPLKQYVNDFKIRGGWGIIGNSGIGNYNALSTLIATSYVLGTGSTVSPGYVDGRVANSKLGWESSRDFGLGVDVELLNRRISLSIDYYYKLTKDMLFSMPLPTLTGFNSYMVNIGSMRNRGFEYMLETRNFVGNFNWTTSFNLSYFKNRVLNTGKDKRPLIANNSYTIEGKPLAGIWGLDFIGPYKDWEDVKTNPIVNANNPLWRDRSAPGTNKMNDVNGDGVINGLDNTILGSPNPDFIWSMTNNFTYKGIDLSIQINGVQGGDRLMTQMESVMSKGLGYGNVVYEYFDNYWRPDRTDAKYAAPTRKSWDGTSDRGTLVFKGTYLNIQNIALGYTLPKSISQRAGFGMKNLRFYASVRNALMITDYPGFNPEVNDSGNSSLSQGVDAGAYPMTRTFSFGINVLL